MNGYTPGRFERSGVIELPFLYGSAEAATDAYDTLFEEGLIAEDFEGLHVVALWTHRPYGTFTNGTAVETLEDFAGLKMRVPSDVTAQTVEALGGAPVGMPVTEIAEALRLGTVDGSMFPYEAVAPFGLEGLFTHFTNTGTLATRFAVVMNEDAHARLSEEQRAALDGLSGREFSLAMAHGFDGAEARVKARGHATALDQSAPDIAEALERETGGRLAAVLDSVGSEATAGLALGALAKGGRCVVVGLYGGRQSYPLPFVPVRVLSILGSYAGSLDDLRELLALLRREGAPVVPIETRPMEEAGRAVADLEAGRVAGRLALTPGGPS